MLYLVGARDRVVPNCNVEDVVRESPSAKVVTIDGPHLALYYNAQAAARVIVDFTIDNESGQLV